MRCLCNDVLVTAVFYQPNSSPIFVYNLATASAGFLYNPLTHFSTA